MNKLLEEILSQGQALQRTIEYISANLDTVFKSIKKNVMERQISRFIFTGMGSSYFSSFIPYYMLKQKGLIVEMFEAGEFLLHGLPENLNTTFEDTCIVLISQSGESGEIVELLQKINSSTTRPLTIGVTNSPQSYLATNTEIPIYLNSGKEETVTSKTYVCSLLLLYFFAVTILNEDFSKANKLEEIDDLIKYVSNLLPSDLLSQPNQNLVQNIPLVKDFLNLFGSDYKFIHILARGSSLATAYQAALNFKEIVKINSAASSISTFRHGEIESLTENSKLIIISSFSRDYTYNNQFILNLIEKWRFGALFYITTQKVDKIDEKIRMHPKIMISSIHISNSFLVSIAEIISLQLIIYNAAQRRGITPGVFKFTQKVTRGL